MKTAAVLTKVTCRCADNALNEPAPSCTRFFIAAVAIRKAGGKAALHWWEDLTNLTDAISFGLKVGMVPNHKGYVCRSVCQGKDSKGQLVKVTA